MRKLKNYSGKMIDYEINPMNYGIIAACTSATEMAKGGNGKRECLQINQSSILGDLAGIPEDHEHCTLLAAMAMQKALRNLAISHKKGPW